MLAHGCVGLVIQIQCHVLINVRQASSLSFVCEEYEAKDKAVANNASG